LLWEIRAMISRERAHSRKISRFRLKVLETKGENVIDLARFVGCLWRVVIVELALQVITNRKRVKRNKRIVRHKAID
jgi:hypothetical protein